MGAVLAAVARGNLTGLLALNALPAGAMVAARNRYLRKTKLLLAIFQLGAILSLAARAVQLQVRHLLAKQQAKMALTSSSAQPVLMKRED